MKALPTTYNGKKYRSATEAKWHAYFDLIGFEVIHEHDAYNINGRNYLPDFMASKGMGFDYYEGHKNKNTPWFVEVKGCEDKALDEFEFMQEFSKETNSLVSLVWGEPSVRPFPTWLKGDAICPSIYCHYGFTRKGWSEPYYCEDELEQSAYSTDKNFECLNRVRCGHRSRRGELVV